MSVAGPEPAELLSALCDLAEQAGLRVRVVDPRHKGSEFPVTSGVCRVRGSLWVVLSAADPVERRLSVLANALRTHAASWVEERYLPPALRACLEGSDSSIPPT